jgi:SAM-dependent methyltransferase
MSQADAAVIATRAAYEAGAAAWASRGVDRSYANPRIEGFVACLPRSDGANLVLDLGCGPGWDSVLLSQGGLRVVSFDITRAMLALSLERPDRGRGLVQGDSRRLPFAAGSFDGVWASASLLHLPKAEAAGALDEVSRTLKRGGAFYSAMKEGAADSIDSPAPGGAVTAPRHFAHYRALEWSNLLRAAGFRLLSQDIDHDSRPGYPDWIVTLAVKE